MLTANHNLNGFFGPNESSSVGAAQAVKARGLTGKVKVIGFDSSPSLTADLQEGIIDSLIVQNPYAMGFEGVRTICEKLAGKNPEPRIDTGVTVVTKNNLSDLKIQQLINPNLEK